MPPLHENMTDYEILQEEISLKVQELEVLRRKLAIEDIKRRREEKKSVQQEKIGAEEDGDGEDEDADDTRATNAGRAAPGLVASGMEVDMENDAADAVAVKPEPEDEADRPARFIDMTLKNKPKPSIPSSKPMGLVFNDEKLQAPPPPKQPLRHTRCSRQRNLAPELPVPDPARELNRPPTKRPATTATSSSLHSNGTLKNSISTLLSHPTISTISHATFSSSILTLFTCSPFPSRIFFLLRLFAFPTQNPFFIPTRGKRIELFLRSRRCTARTTTCVFGNTD
ncbi:hypothetical protein D6D15_07780 [Aureobasidium pullulans]|uniref:Uncharacterized protein n=1 Tax=Aureobasidium pullulans TaxID=5580 RepID=A0A4S9B064_AURPU|nr:hypothetical protein D6D15_07780 [Aureobasidium pullulans]